MSMWSLRDHLFAGSIDDETKTQKVDLPCPVDTYNFFDFVEPEIF